MPSLGEKSGAEPHSLHDPWVVARDESGPRYSRSPATSTSPSDFKAGLTAVSDDEPPCGILRFSRPATPGCKQRNGGLWSGPSAFSANGQPPRR
jgi:hypothetical protein